LLTDLRKLPIDKQKSSPNFFPGALSRQHLLNFDINHATNEFLSSHVDTFYFRICIESVCLKHAWDKEVDTPSSHRAVATSFSKAGMERAAIGWSKRTTSKVGPLPTWLFVFYNVALQLEQENNSTICSFARIGKLHLQRAIHCTKDATSSSQVIFARIMHVPKLPPTAA
jgi:hypothetical protein